MLSAGGEEFERTREAGRTVVDTIRDAFVAGLAIVVPVIVTLVVLNVLAGYVFSTLSGFVEFIQAYDLSPAEARVFAAITPATAELVLQILTLVVLTAVILGLGFLTRFTFGERFIQYADDFIGAIPGVGSVYDGFREMSDVIVESDQQNFRDVKLVEFPQEDTYTLGFLTADTPAALQAAAGRNDMVTVFLPLAPNPVMGGNLVHVPEHRVEDVDMTVEEGIRTIVTSGVATGDGSANGDARLSEAELSQMDAFQQAEDRMGRSEADEATDPIDNRQTEADVASRDAK
ncbi:DUF502 domain-containing protein [Haloarchaeobius amylolyticus]|uniref:DUF502 domain-containing protein n=1 Tax=Haloarchaeobius amylolyticus TaxID=1198296 RepID=UPI0022716495|nr:DUF502 domain-containing protein [Haloarchaeobius amylolyticus]